MLEVTPYLFSGFTANTYLLRDRATRKTLVIDPGADEAALGILGAFAPEAILLTHAHFDHALIAPELRAQCGAKILLGALDAPLFCDPVKNASVSFHARPLAATADGLLSEGDEIALGESVITVLHTPGHSPGSVSFRCGDILFSGDTLFADGVGRTDLFGGNERELENSLKRLLSFPSDTRVYPGHGPDFWLPGSRGRGGR